MTADPAYLRLCDAILSRDAKKLLKLIMTSNFVDVNNLDIEDPLGCIALLDVLGLIQKI